MTEAGAAPASCAAPMSGDRALAWRSRLAGLGLVLVLLAVSGFAVLTSQTTSAAAAEAARATSLSNDYDRAAHLVTTQQSLHHEHRVEPQTVVRDRHLQAGRDVVRVLLEIRREGTAGDRRLVDDVLDRHEDYRSATARLFRADLRDDAAGSQQISDSEVDKSFVLIETAVLDAAQRNDRTAQRALDRLERLESASRRSTPLVFLTGLLLAAGLAWVTRGHRRLLDRERGQAVHRSLHDGLTGLPNRTLLADRVRQALAADERGSSATALLLIDLDRFKEVNDTFGHHYGDELLVQVGARLRSVLRAVDTVARLGGDEFAVVLPGVAGVEDATAVAEQLGAALRAPFAVESVSLDVEASIGVVVSGRHGTDVMTLLKRADVAMYVAKRQDLGVFAYDPAVDVQSPAQLALHGDLRRALERDEVVVHYRPDADSSTGEVVRADALVHWRHPERGLVLPDEVLALAERTGLVHALTRHVLGVALSQARSWCDVGRPLLVSVALSSRDLLDERLPALVAELLERHAVPPSLLELEVTGSAVADEPVRAQRLLGQLSELGVRLSIDDVHAGSTGPGQLDLDLEVATAAAGVRSGQAGTTLSRSGRDAQHDHLSRPMGPDAFDLWRSGREPSGGAVQGAATAEVPAGPRA